MMCLPPLVLSLSLGTLLLLPCPAQSQEDTPEDSLAWTPFATQDTYFAGLDSLEVRVLVNDVVREVVDENRLRTKFELTLRGNAVPVAPSSWSIFSPRRETYVRLAVEGLWDSERNFVTFIVQTELVADIFFYRKGVLYRDMTPIWSTLKYGYAGSQLVRESIVGAVEEHAEDVANRYLSANR